MLVALSDPAPVRQVAGEYLQQFTATVANTGNTAVTWSLSPNVGTVDGTGLYTAPASVPSQQTVTVTATSVADTTKSASATVALNPPVTVSVTPLTAVLKASQTQHFVATVGNTSNTAVTWSISPATGTLSSAGLYTAPATIAADITKNASATVTLNPPVTISSLSASSGAPGAQITISGSGFGAVQGTGSVWLGSTTGTVVSWGNTQIVAMVASNSMTGTAQVQQNGVFSNSKTFTINTASITGVSPASGAVGTQITIIGSGFGASQGSGQIWLGTVNGTVQTWSDSQVVATVAAGATGSGARILQNGVMSASYPFTVATLTLSGISPTSGGSGTAVTFTGAGFGAAPGVVWLGSTAGTVLSWSDTQVVASVASGALSGVAWIQQNGVQSNAKTFTVPVPGGGTSMSVLPNLLNMMVGDTRTLQALSSTGQTLAGLTWSSSDPTVVSLSTDDPPVLTAVAAGHVTITAGTASADVTVWPVSSSGVGLPLGTVLWSNPGNGSGVSSIVPAVPSSSGVADVFAIQNDGTVQAITSDGITAWTADVSYADWWDIGWVVPDFQGGLVVAGNNTIAKLDGTTGQAYPAYTVPSSANLPYTPPMVVHTDGTIFAVQQDRSDYGTSVVGIDPTTGTQKFSVPVTDSNTLGETCDPIIAGDGNAYLAYVTRQLHPISSNDGTEHDSLALLQINTSGASAVIKVSDWMTTIYDEGSCPATLITNSDQGVVVSWEQDTGPEWDLSATYHMATTTGTSVSIVSAPTVPGQNGPVAPVVQAQDGSFVGGLGVGDASTPYMVAFDVSGNVRWTVPNETPQIATADGGVIGQSGTTYDANGNATGMTGQFTQSWLGNTYQVGSVDQLYFLPQLIATSFWAFQGANSSATLSAAKLDRYPELMSCHDKGGSCAVSLGPRELMFNAKNDLVNQLTTDQTCFRAAQTAVFGKIQWGGIFSFFPIPANGPQFVQYLGRTQHFYDGARSNLTMGEAGGPATLPVRYIWQEMADPATATTAIAVTPSYPFQSFWQPGYTGPNHSDPNASTAFGVGIDSSKNGANIYNESVLLHEGLHAVSGLPDNALETFLLGATCNGGSQCVSDYIKSQVLSHCPSFRTNQ